MPKSSETATLESDAIAKRAYELYLQRGSVPGYELDDWLQAEAELSSAAATPPMSPSAPPRFNRWCAGAPPAASRNRPRTDGSERP